MDNFDPLSLIIKAKHIFFVGIGGISMQSLAHTALSLGKTVSGSDRSASAATRSLEEAGCRIVIGHFEESVIGADLVVYTAAVSKSSPELLAAEKAGIPTLSRSEFLGSLMQLYQTRIGISGTHGKTTTTTLLAHIALSLDKDPTVMNGALSKTLDNKAYRIGKEKALFLYEACEYKASFHDFYPTTAVITNVELDHTDYYESLDHIIEAFKKSLCHADTVIVNADDENAMKAVEGFRGRSVTFSLTGKGSYNASNIRHEGRNTTFFLSVKGGDSFEVTLPLLGDFNVLNALAALAAVAENGMELSCAVKALSCFSPPDRRFEILQHDRFLLADDYAHHPSEIMATLKGAREMLEKGGRLIVIFQSHTYTRTHDLFDGFVEALSPADRIYMPDIFAAREVNTVGVSSETLCRAIGDKATYLADFEKIAAAVLETVGENDIVLTMGAGDVYKIGLMIRDQMKNNNDIK